MQGSITKDYSAYKITTGSSYQDIALVFGEGVEDEKYVSFSVKWLELAKVEIIKVDSRHENAKLSGAIFGIYSDPDCTKLITEMPATDENGSSVAEIVKTQDTVYLKEIQAPEGYRLNTAGYNVKLIANDTASVTVPDQEQMGELTIYKEGQVLTGADVTEEGVTFRYEDRRQEGAVYNVYAGEDIVTAYGAKIYSKGDLVKGNLTTDDNGSAVLKNLHLGTYVIREVQAPENFYNAGEEKPVTLSYAGQNVETVFSESTFHKETYRPYGETGDSAGSG
ncbi:MSCRAMM family protein [Mediterraneibacter glycyrrhizinilyticus]|uniref:MSCRAMM family protein n=1 Tax=Mediterraneibacter glycyrrhizinilyticus TaxID=342942 RepID=UPI002FE6ED70